MSDSRSDKEQDPFSLSGKNPRRVAPAVRRTIEVQRGRIFTSLGFTVGLVLLSALCAWSSWIPGGLEVLCLMLTPFALVGAVFDWGVLRRQKAKLAECERLIALEDGRHEQT